ncbi:hypothetical protein ABIE27_004630 [Paenibacillus sp. 4624]|uniref:hypothetical protein n=1 Tax=Paenibacillus sp. 4624 TaxID=3156453 RepID=UPI003D2392A6
MQKLHLDYKGEISVVAFEILEKMYLGIKDDSYHLDEEIMSKAFKGKELSNIQKCDTNLKLKIAYQRYCILIKELLNEYSELSEDEKGKIIDYYLFDNRLEELYYLGLGHYYNAKFKKSQAVLFRSNGGDRNTPVIHGMSSNLETVKLIFNQCREHINKGKDKVRLYSYSKCFGIVLFKYLSIEQDKDSVELRILPNQNINVIYNNDTVMSLQQFIMDEYKASKTDYCIDMSSVRSGKRDNLAVWMKNFLGERSIEIQKIHSPVSDQEVVASRILNQEISNSFNEEELIYLLYRYYKKYYEVRNNDNGDKFRHEFEKVTTYLNEEFEKQLSDNHGENNTQQLKILKAYIERFKLCLGGNEAHDKKVDLIFNFIDWSKENLNLEKDTESIYKFEFTNSMITNFKGFLHNYLMKVSEDLW